MEHQLSEMKRKAERMANTVKRANDEKEAMEESLKKIQQIPELDEIRGRRARSISPGIFYND